MRGLGPARPGKCPQVSADLKVPDRIAVVARFWPLWVLAAVVVWLEVAGVLPRWPGLVHLVAVPPLDLFADLRLILAMSRSWPFFAVMAIALFAVRVVVLAVLMGGLMMVGLRPGPLLFQDHADFIWTLIGTFYIGNLVLVFLTLLAYRHAAAPAADVSVTRRREVVA